MRRVRLMTILAVAASAAACAALKPAVAPIRTVRYVDRAGAPCTVVLLPGRWNAPEEFGRAGFPAVLEDGGVRAAIVAPDAHLGYYMRETVLERLRHDVVGPARAAGRPVWVVGVSMGGLGALLYARDHPGELAGIVAIAPFLGDRDVIDEITSSGGLDAWEPARPPAPDDYQRRLWLWLKEVTASDVGMPELYLGYGTDDRFAGSAELLGAQLEGRRVLAEAGGHDWPTWRRLFERIVAAGAIGPPCR
ncbi:MAG: alpha/beta hydrolase-fold protein [Acidobacteriota bacterium]